MSYSYVIPGERISSGRAKRWLLAYPVAQCLCLCAAAAMAALGRSLQDVDPSSVTFATGIAVACVYGLTFGYLRGCLLRERLARFSMLLWCGAIAAVSMFLLPPAPEALPDSPAPCRICSPPSRMRISDRAVRLHLRHRDRRSRGSQPAARGIRIVRLAHSVRHCLGHRTCCRDGGCGLRCAA